MTGISPIGGRSKVEGATGYGVTIPPTMNMRLQLAFPSKVPTVKPPMSVCTQPGWTAMLRIPSPSYPKDWHLVSMFRAALLHR